MGWRCTGWGYELRIDLDVVLRTSKSIEKVEKEMLRGRLSNIELGL